MSSRSKLLLELAKKAHEDSEDTNAIHDVSDAAIDELSFDSDNGNGYKIYTPPENLTAGSSSENGPQDILKIYTPVGNVNHHDSSAEDGGDSPKTYTPLTQLAPFDADPFFGNGTVDTPPSNNVELYDFSPDNTSDDYQPSYSDISSDEDSDEEEEIDEGQTRKRKREIEKVVDTSDKILEPLSEAETFKENIAPNSIQELVLNTNNKVQSVKKKLFSLPEKTSRKRQKHPENWKRNKAAKSRERGESYTSQTGKEMPAKTANTMGNLCKKGRCKLNCDSKFSTEAREQIFKKFYKLDVNAKNTLLFKSIIVGQVQRHRKNIRKPKSASFKYTVSYDKAVIFVCKSAICSLYQISEKKLRVIRTKLFSSGGSALSPDKRGHHDNRPHKISPDVLQAVKNHISQFPAEISHYSRNKNQNKKYLSPELNISKMYKLYLEDCTEKGVTERFKVKKCTYSNIFSTHFNLSFGHPRSDSDTCSTCDANLNTEEHKSQYKFAFEQQKRDRNHARSTENVCYLTMDLQQTQPLPKITTSKAFYLRQLWFYNFSIHSVTKSGETPYFFTWTENIAGKGSLEVGNSFHTFAQLLDKKIDHLIVWSDSCSGQNKNFNIVALYQYLIFKGMFKLIDHKFPEVGHSFLDSDRDFGRIEKNLRKREKILIPDQYREIIKLSSIKSAVVINMENHFKDLEQIIPSLRLVNKKKNLLNEKVNFRDHIKWIRVDEYGSYLYKESLDEFTPFHKVNILRNGAKKADSDSFALQVTRNKRNEVSNEKKANIREQLPYIDDEFKYFYEIFLERDDKNDKTKNKNGNKK